MNNEEKFFISHTHDKCRECINKNMLTQTGFLDLHEQSLVLSERYDCPFLLFGGYDDAERKMLLFLPAYEVSQDDYGISVLGIKISSKSPLSHRDYLGALMSLGIKRENIGDIIVNDCGAQIIVRDEICNFLLSNLVRAGHTTLDCEVLPLSSLNIGEIKFKEFSKTVASPRVDCVVSAIFNLSRTAGSEAVKNGLVFVNGREVQKQSLEISQGDKITVRRCGKAVVTEIGGLTRKGRTVISGKIYS